MHKFDPQVFLPVVPDLQCQVLTWPYSQRTNLPVCKMPETSLRVSLALLVRVPSMTITIMVQLHEEQRSFVWELRKTPWEWQISQMWAAVH